MQSCVVLGEVARLNVAVTGLGARGLNSEDDHVVANGGQSDALLQRLQKTRLVGNNVVRWENSQNGARILPLDEKCGQGAGGRCVAGNGLLNNLRCGNTAQLIGNLLGQKIVGDNPGFIQTGQRLEPLHRLLDHGAFSVKRKHLFGACAA